MSSKLAFASIALGTSQRSDAHLSMRFIYDPTHHIAQVSKRIEDGAQEVADAAPRKAQAASDEIEGAAKAVADRPRPRATQVTHYPKVNQCTTDRGSANETGSDKLTIHEERAGANHLLRNASAMSDHLDESASALGRIPSGIFILTTNHEGRSTGMLASWVQQAGFEPPMLTVAVRRDRYVADWINASRKFTLNQVAAGNKSLLKHFGRGFGPEEAAFAGITLRGGSQDGPILAGAMAYLQCEVAGSIDGGDHRLYLATVVKGERIDHDAEPMIHLRKSGLHY